MNKYLTEYWVSNEVGRVCKMAGEIMAESLEDAERRVPEGHVVLGKWSGDVEWEGADGFCDKIQAQRDKDWLEDQE